MDRDRVPVGSVQRAVVTAMPTALVAFWWSAIRIDRSDGDLAQVLAVGLIASVVLALTGMWFTRVRAFALGASAGVVAGILLALLVAGGLLATSG